MGRLDNKVAIVTGGTGGIGQSFNRALAENGAKVVVVDIDEIALARTVDEMAEEGYSDVLPILTDITNQSSTEKMAQTILEKWGRIDILVNNAAYRALYPFDQIPDEEWDRTYDVNVKGIWYCIKAVFPAMKRQRKGKIINIGSQTFFTGWPNYFHYVGTKGAVIGMTRQLAIEVGPLGIRVNCMCPGLTMTEHSLADVERNLRPGGVRQWVDDHVDGQCIKHPAYPEDLNGTLIFLASDDSDFVTGQTIVVDGGWAKH